MTCETRLLEKTTKSLIVPRGGENLINFVKKHADLSSNESGREIILSTLTRKLI
jgi:gamma-glutamyl phosphate reductase